MFRTDTSTTPGREDGVRFGRTLVRVQSSDWAQSGFDVVVIPNNRRGLLGVNIVAGSRIDGGLEVEREAMLNAPHTLGTAITTGAGDLARFGVTNVVHAIVSEKLGDGPRELQLRQAMLAALKQVDAVKGRHVALVPLGSGSRIERVDRAQSIPIMIEELVGYLRRSSTRMETITFLCNSQPEVADTAGLLQHMRRDWWVNRG